MCESNHESVFVIDMVASGVPRRNGQRHAVSITDMALDLVEVSHSFVIPHMPNEPLKIRVGLHSGDVQNKEHAF